MMGEGKEKEGRDGREGEGEREEEEDKKGFWRGIREEKRLCVSGMALKIHYA